MDGYRAIGTLVIGGKDAFKKGEVIANAVIKKCSSIFNLRDKFITETMKSPFENTSTKGKPIFSNPLTSLQSV